MPFSVVFGYHSLRAADRYAYILVVEALLVIYSI
jgi:hypothetical protein